MAETYYNLWNQLRSEIGDYFPVPVAKLYIKRAMREVSNRTNWSWLIRLEEIQVPVAINGQVTVTVGSKQVIVDAALATAINSLTSPPIGRRQLRIGTTGGAVFEIREWDGINTLTLNWPIPATFSNGTYSCVLLRAYYLPPTVEQSGITDPAESPNFKCFHVVKDKSNNFPLNLSKTSAWIDKRDPRRDAVGTPSHLVQMPPTTSLLPGSGNDPGQIPPGTPRFELWPHPTGPYVYDCLYELNYWPLEDNPTSTLPETLNPDLVLNFALEMAYRWALAQTKVGNRNQVAVMASLLQNVRQRKEELYLEAYREDKLFYEARTKDLLGGKFPWVMGAAYAQTHDIYSMTGFIE